MNTVVIGEKHTFLELTLYSHSGVYGNTRKPKFVAQRPDFEMQTHGFRGQRDAFWQFVFRQVCGLHIFEWHWSSNVCVC